MTIQVKNGFRRQRRRRPAGTAAFLGKPAWPLRLGNFSAVIFDMDGVLIDTMPYHARAWIDVLAQAGIRVSEQDVYAREGEPGADSLSYFLRRQGLASSPGFIRSLLDRKEQRFKRIARIKPFPGVATLVAALKRRGLKLAIVTGTARHELLKVMPGKLLAYFDASVTGDEVAKGKPDPEPYRMALRKLCLRPDQAVVIENAPLGIASARAAGLACLAVESSMKCPDLPSADGCFPSIQRLARFLLAT